MSLDHMKAMTESSMDNRTCCPSPLRSFASSAAVSACEAVNAVTLSGTMVRIRRGRSASEPACTVVRPDSAWMIGS